MTGPWAQEVELKKLFAIGLLKKPLRRPSDSYELATTIFGGDTVNAMRAGSSWPIDPLVLKFKAELLEEHGADYFLPTQEEIAREILEAARETGDSGKPIHDAKEREKLLRLYCEVRGFIVKSGKQPVPNDPNAAPPDIIFDEYPADAQTA